MGPTIHWAIPTFFQALPHLLSPTPTANNMGHIIFVIFGYFRTILWNKSRSVLWHLWLLTCSGVPRCINVTSLFGELMKLCGQRTWSLRRYQTQLQHLSVWTKIGDFINCYMDVSAIGINIWQSTIVDQVISRTDTNRQHYDSRLSTQTPACAGGNLDGQTAGWTGKIKSFIQVFPTNVRSRYVQVKTFRSWSWVPSTYPLLTWTPDKW